MHATDYLKSPKTAPVIALSGSEEGLKRAVIAKLTEQLFDDGADSLTRFRGKDTDFKTVQDELRTISMFADTRLVIVDDANDFVTAYRPALEKYVANPAKSGTLVLDVKSFPKNTRLAKGVIASGLHVECTELKGQALSRWVVNNAKSQHGKQIDHVAAALLTELAGSNVSLLEQELTKLASYVGDRGQISAEDVRKLVGGWKAETTWNMLNALRDGDTNHALLCLEKLLIAGEAPQKILGGINFVFKKFAVATELARSGLPLQAALKAAGVFPRDTGPAGQYLRRVGRARAEEIYALLLQADLDMKGGSRLSERIQLEKLLIRLAGHKS